MTWSRFSEDFADRIEVMNLSADAFRLHVEAVILCNRLTRDGDLPTAYLRKLTACPPEALEELTAAGLWEATDEGWLIDWRDQETAEVVQARRARNAERNREYRLRKELHAAGDHSKCHPGHCPALRDGARDASRDLSRAVDRSAPVRPVPSTSVDRGKGPGNGSACATPPRPAGEKCPHGVLNGIRTGQCPDDECADEFSNLTKCAGGDCHQVSLGEPTCSAGACWLRDEWPAERDQALRELREEAS